MARTDVNCPYCGEGQNINHDDGYGYKVDVVHTQECAKCSKTFIYKTHISFSYNVDKADCLNGGDHNWKPTRSYPEMYTMMRCDTCDEERRPTDAEWEKITAARIN